MSRLPGTLLRYVRDRRGIILTYYAGVLLSILVLALAASRGGPVSPGDVLYGLGLSTVLLGAYLGYDFQRQARFLSDLQDLLSPGSRMKMRPRSVSPRPMSRGHTGMSSLQAWRAFANPSQGTSDRRVPPAVCRPMGPSHEDTCIGDEAAGRAVEFSVSAAPRGSSGSRAVCSRRTSACRGASIHS